MTHHTDTQASTSPRHHTIDLEGSASPTRMFEDLRKRNERRAVVARMVGARRAELAPRTTSAPTW